MAMFNSPFLVLISCVLLVWCGGASDTVRDKIKVDIANLEDDFLELKNDIISYRGDGSSTQHYQDGNMVLREELDKEQFSLENDLKSLEKASKDDQPSNEEDDHLDLDYAHVAQDMPIYFKNIRLNTDAKIPMTKRQKSEFLSQLQPYLHDQTIEERLKVWAAMADIKQKLFDNSGMEKKEVNEFNVEDEEDLYEGDIVLDARSVEQVKENFNQMITARDPEAQMREKVKRMVSDLLESEKNPGLHDPEERARNKRILARLRHKALITLYENEDEDLPVQDSETALLEEMLQDVVRKTSLTHKSSNSADEVDKRKMLSTIKWTMPIPYRFDEESSHTEAQQAMIHKAIKYWEKETCVRFRFVKDKDHIPGDNLVFKKGKGCSSPVGERPGRNTILLGDGCFLVGRIAHEIGHSLGFWHEQNRPDRDSYVKINGNKLINPKYKRNFIKMSWKLVLTMGIPYDMGSAMHYGGTYFEKPGVGGFTVETTDPNMQRVLGQRFALSFYDIKIANFRYCQKNCSGHDSLEWDKCDHDGYRDPNDCTRCKCPDGWTGQYCDKVDSGDCSDTTLQAKEEPGYFTSPGYEGDGYERGQKCAWKIEAPHGWRVVLKFQSGFKIRSNPDLSCKYPFCQDWVEVRDKSLSQTGPRLCCETAPKQTFKSTGHEMLVIFRAHLGSGLRGFKAMFYAERCGGCSKSALVMEDACSKHERYSCPGVYYEDCGFMGWMKCKRERENYCYKVVQYCCDGHKLHHDGTCRRLEEETRPKEQAKNSKNYAAREYLKAI